LIRFVFPRGGSRCGYLHSLRAGFYRGIVGGNLWFRVAFLSRLVLGIFVVLVGSYLGSVGLSWLLVGSGTVPSASESSTISTCYDTRSTTIATAKTGGDGRAQQVGMLNMEGEKQKKLAARKGCFGLVMLFAFHFLFGG